MPSLHRSIKLHSLRGIFNKYETTASPQKIYAPPSSLARPLQSSNLAKSLPQSSLSKPLPQVPPLPPPPPPKESPELRQWRQEFQKIIIKLYKEKPRILSELNRLASSAFGKKHWAEPFMRGRRNGVYTSEELFICETLQKIGVVGEKRTEGNVKGELVWAPPGVVWKGFKR